MGRRVRRSRRAPWRRSTAASLRADTVLIRPDGYVAWAGGTEAGLREALLAWFGRPRVPAAVTG